MDKIVAHLPSQFRVVGRDVVSTGRHDAGRMILEAMLSDLLVKEVSYVIRGEDKMWTIVYSTTAAEFEKRLPVFERSVKTFAVQPPQ